MEFDWQVIKDYLPVIGLGAIVTVAVGILGFARFVEAGTRLRQNLYQMGVPGVKSEQDK